MCLDKTHTADIFSIVNEKEASWFISSFKKFSALTALFRDAGSCSYGVSTVVKKSRG